MKKLIQWFIPEEYRADEIKLQKARYFVTACIFTSAFSFFYFLVSVYFNMRMPMAAMVHDTMLIGLLPFLFKKGLKINIAANLFVLIGTIGVTWTSFYSGGFEAGTLVWYTVLPIASLLLANKKSSYVWTSVCLAIVLIFGIMQIQGFPFENQTGEDVIHHFDISAMTGVVLMLFLLALVFENTKQRAFTELHQKNQLLSNEKKRSDDLLLNILPEEVADELKEYGGSKARGFDNVSVMFTDFKGFTEISTKLTPEQLVEELNYSFKEFDLITVKYGIEKIKTIGDAYMAAGGLSQTDENSALNTVKAAMAMQEAIKKRKKEQKAKGLPFFDMRVGVHTGKVVAGIVGVKKFQYDIWGDVVNTASRLESSCEIGQVNISETTKNAIQNEESVEFINRGFIEAKGKGLLEMYYVKAVAEKLV